MMEANVNPLLERIQAADLVGAYRVLAALPPQAVQEAALRAGLGVVGGRNRKDRLTFIQSEVARAVRQHEKPVA